MAHIAVGLLSVRWYSEAVGSTPIRVIIMLQKDQFHRKLSNTNQLKSCVDLLQLPTRAVSNGSEAHLIDDDTAVISTACKRSHKLSVAFSLIMRTQFLIRKVAEVLLISCSCKSQIILVRLMSSMEHSDTGCDYLVLQNMNAIFLLRAKCQSESDT